MKIISTEFSQYNNAPKSTIPVDHQQGNSLKSPHSSDVCTLFFSHIIMSVIFARRMTPLALLGVHSRRQILSKSRLEYKQVLQFARLSSNTDKKPKPSQNLVVASYCAALATFILGVSYASVPLYKVFCSMTGLHKSSHHDHILHKILTLSALYMTKDSEELHSAPTKRKLLL